MAGGKGLAAIFLGLCLALGGCVVDATDSDSSEVLDLEEERVQHTASELEPSRDASDESPTEAAKTTGTRLTRESSESSQHLNLTGDPQDPDPTPWHLPNPDDGPGPDGPSVDSGSGSNSSQGRD